jgi:hypothetical protein
LVRARGAGIGRRPGAKIENRMKNQVVDRMSKVPAHRTHGRASKKQLPRESISTLVIFEMIFILDTLDEWPTI